MKLRRIPCDSRALVALVAVLFCSAPVPGDVGSCGQPAVELDPERFFASKGFIDCEKCRECELDSDACARACEGRIAATSFADGCRPLVHDGEVCLRALAHASCGDYANYVTDRQPEVPTECNFCPVR